jgi:hypothetical protein
MSTILVNNIKSYTGTTVTISGSNIFVTGKTTLGDGSGTDTVKIRAELGISGSIVVSGSITPHTDDMFDIGSATHQWKDLYVDGTANIDTGSIEHLIVRQNISSSLIPDIGMFANRNPHDLGSATHQWQELHVRTASIDVHSLPTSSIGAVYSGGLYTLLGSEIFSSSAWTANPGSATFPFMSADFSSSKFVFQRA